MNLKSPKSILLLEANLDVLHEQSKEWLSELEFWRDELAFYYTLFIEKTHVSVPVKAKNIITTLEKELLRMIEEDLGDLERRVREHEVFLGALLERLSSDEKTYREKHRLLSHELSHFERRLKAVKKNAFDLVRMTARQEAKQSPPL